MPPRLALTIDFGIMGHHDSECDVSDAFTRAEQLLRWSLNDPSGTFRSGQWEAIEAAVVRSERVLVVQRTGWGKSAVYFIATRMLRDRGAGPTLIVSPLLALMRNQIASANRYGVRVATINSDNTPDEDELTKEAVLGDQVDALIISPEKLANEEFLQEVLSVIANRVGLLVIDEAHCISDWGHDFRPDYRRIQAIIERLPGNVPIVATTATANARVMDDLVVQLGSDIEVQRGELTRSSLQLHTLFLAKRSQRLAWLAHHLRFVRGTGIIYVATTRDAELVSAWLQSLGYAVEPYYGSIQGLTKQQNRQRRVDLEVALLNNQLKALIATSALGMGFDKPDLAFVIHFQSPGSAVAYYQQVGRAGRGLDNAIGLLMSGDEDNSIQDYFISSAFPTEELVNEILDVLEASDDGLRLAEFYRRVNARSTKIQAALKFLSVESPAPVVSVKRQREGDTRPGKVYSRTLTRYRIPRETIERLCTLRRREWETMRRYIQHEGCQMQFLASELDDHSSEPCGRCQNCAPDSRLPADYPAELADAAVAFLGRQEITIKPKHRAASSRAEAALRFPVDAFEFNLAQEGLANEPGRALAHWNDAGWGELAVTGKRSGAFDPRLVDGARQLILGSWRPEPMPRWVTFVPSLRRPALVEDFARGLARTLGLECRAAVVKIRDNPPQKTMQNSFFQAHNLDGVFQIKGPIPPGAVLLVDDVYDSGWTLTVVGALLRRSGVEAVHPFCLLAASAASEPTE